MIREKSPERGGIRSRDLVSFCSQGVCSKAQHSTEEAFRHPIQSSRVRFEFWSWLRYPKLAAGKAKTVVMSKKINPIGFQQKLLGVLSIACSRHFKSKFVQGDFVPFGFWFIRSNRS